MVVVICFFIVLISGWFWVGRLLTFGYCFDLRFVGFILGLTCGFMWSSDFYVNCWRCIRVHEVSCVAVGLVTDLIVVFISCTAGRCV